VGELKRYVAAADEDDPLGEVSEVEEVVTQRHEVGAGDAERPGACTGGDNDVARREDLIADRHLVRTDEPGGFVVDVDPSLLKTLFLPPGDGIDE